MNLLETIKLNIESDEVNKSTTVSNCPNCWGIQEYSNAFHDTVQIERVNTNNLLAKKGWIQAYVM